MTSGTLGIVETHREIAEQITSKAAPEVDAEGRFPEETFDALRNQRLLSALIPTELGGAGASLPDVARSITEVARACSSSGLILAMHHIQVACLVRHGKNERLVEYQREVAVEQHLLASATTEINIGGNTRTSGCAVQRHGDTFSLAKTAPVISYGEYADGVFATARRDEDAPPSEQVLVVCRRGDLHLEPISTWDALGFRGTCSRGFRLEASGPTAFILDDSFGDISEQTMLPTSHLLWASCWLGIALSATALARGFVQSAARRNPGTMPPAGTRLAQVTAKVEQLRGLVANGLTRYDDLIKSRQTPTMSFSIAMNSIKVAASGLLIEIVSESILIVGIMGYKQDSPVTLGRHLRDAYGAELMVNNDRINLNTAQMLLAYRDR